MALGSTDGRTAMTFEVEIDGHVRTISIENVGAAGVDGGRFRVSVRDTTGTVAHRTLTVDARPTENKDSWISRTFSSIF